jgi:murein DD-endopeptidase MepM/ murein hydrolase activator NlpD
MKPLFVILIFFIAISSSKTQTLFIWPVKPISTYSEVAGYYVINNFVDQNTTAAILDWNCGTRTYDTHRGIDIDLWPFTWSMMDNNYVAVIAAAPGRVVAAVSNLNNENNCGQPGENTNWNYIAIRHADSSTSIYGHIRTNSAQVVVGQIVAAGDAIAFVGSSGNSSNPHLHFEVNNLPVTNSQAAGLIDPYAGPCNTLNVNSWWAVQKPYWEPTVVRVLTHGNRPVLPGYNGNSTFCRNGEVKNAKNAFIPNDSIYFGIGMRDFLQNQSFTVSVFDQNGALWFSESTTNNTGTVLRRRYYTLDKKLPSVANPGTYRVVVDFNGTISVHFFSIDCLSTQNITEVITGHRGFKASNLITSTATMSAGNRLLLQAGTKITLSPGFVAANGSILKARIRDCNFSE